MLTGENRNKVDKIWETLWTAGISNPLTVVEQLTYLLFIKELGGKNGSTFRKHMEGALFLFPKPSTLKRVEELMDR